MPPDPLVIMWPWTKIHGAWYVCQWSHYYTIIKEFSSPLLLPLPWQQILPLSWSLEIVWGTPVWPKIVHNSISIPCSAVAWVLWSILSVNFYKNNITITSKQQNYDMQLVFAIAVAFLLLRGAKAQQQQAQQDGGRCMIYSQDFYSYGTSFV